MTNTLKSYKAAGCINFEPEDLDAQEKLEFIQHYVTGTPLLDFTKDPLTALYFASAGLPSYVKRELEYKDEYRYLTVIRLNLKIIKDLFGYLEKGEYKDTNEYKKEYEEMYKNQNFMLYLVSTVNQIINPNIRLQAGLFLYFDCYESLDAIINIEAENQNRRQRPHIDLPNREVIIEFHNIPYTSIFRVAKNDCINIYAYLMRKNKIGINLFENDKEGLKMDLSNGDIIEALSCLNKQDYSTCECMRILKDKCGLNI